MSDSTQINSDQTGSDQVGPDQTDPNPIDPSQQDGPTGIVGKGAIGVAAFLMALPAAVPILVIVEPSLVPFVSPVDTGDTGMIAFLVGMALVLLLANWGALYLIYRWLNDLAREEAR